VLGEKSEGGLRDGASKSMMGGDGYEDFTGGGARLS